VGVEFDVWLAAIVGVGVEDDVDVWLAAIVSVGVGVDVILCCESSVPLPVKLPLVFD